MKILISACLLGHPVRYDGQSKKVFPLDERFEYHPICPEVLGGLSTPRNPSEILGKKVYSNKGLDVTEAFETGALKTLEYAKKHHIEVAVLKQNSPSCGTLYVYDGSFQNRKVRGMGFTARLLKAHNIKVYDEEQWSAWITKEVERYI